jgi:uncharacterized protein YkwD
MEAPGSKTSRTDAIINVANRPGWLDVNTHLGLHRSATMASKSLFSTRRRTHLWLEQLESRQLLSAAQPTAAEQLLLEELNDARANPAAYGLTIGVDLSNVAPAQPLAFSPQLIAAAEQHSQDMNARAYFSHITPEGVDPGGRMAAAGFPIQSWGESIAGGTSYLQPGDALSALIVDAGIPDLGHRRQLLAIDAIFKNQNEVGVGIVQNGGGPLTNYYTIDTASSAANQVFLTGVVFRDLNGNSKYDIGEGLGGVTISVSGVGSVTTWAAGGYSIPVAPGTYTVVASGPGLAEPIVQTVTVGSTNVRLNFNATTGSSQGQPGFISKLYLDVLGRAATGGELAYWSGVLQQSGMSAVVAGVEGSSEARSRLVKSWYQTFLGRAAINGEEQGWVNLLNQGTSPEAVLNDILSSDEFFIRANSLGKTGDANANYITTLYTLLLNRSPGSGEIASWVSQLPVIGRPALIQSILNSSEYRTDIVRSYYSGLLHRSTAPTAAEIAGWVNSGLDLITIRMNFEASAEFALNG